MEINNNVMEINSRVKFVSINWVKYTVELIIIKKFIRYFTWNIQTRNKCTNLEKEGNYFKPVFTNRWKLLKAFKLGLFRRPQLVDTN